MEALIEKIMQLVQAHSHDREEQLLVLNAALARLASTATVKKLHSGGLPELVACHALGLRWESESAHGADAYDAQGRGVELKTIQLGKRATRTNVNYVYPRDTDVVQHYARSPAYAGGHYWVAMNGRKTKVLWHTYFTQREFADLVAKRLLANPIEVRVNFGSTLCPRCRRCPRFDELHQLPKHVCNC